MSTGPLSSIRQCHFLLADVSGYTSYMAETELEHAQEIMGSVLNLLVDELTPLLKLAEIEGDAVFVYGPEEPLPRGETLVELIEATYVAFRDALVGMHRATTCKCRACSAIPDLDLKFVVHFGEYALQNVAGSHKPVGSDVNLVHRLLKNGVAEATGWGAYALFSEPCLQQLGIDAEGLYENEESYEHLGPVRGRALDLGSRYQELVAERRSEVPADEAHLVVHHDIAAPPARVWAWLNEPELRGQWLAGTTWTAGTRPGGRSGVGAENHCAHRTGTAVERITDWKPFEHSTSEATQGPLCIRQTNLLTRTEAGTHLEVRCQLATRLPRPLGRLFFRLGGQAKAFDTLARLAGGDP